MAEPAEIITAKTEIESVNSEIDKKSKEVGYDPKKDTNWCHLPIEMRERCIKSMDFETRMRLRYSSSIERTLVDREKYEFHSFCLNNYGEPIKTMIDLTVCNDKDGKEKVVNIRYDSTSNVDLSLPGLLLKMGTFQQIEADVDIGTNLEHLEKFAPFRFKILEADCVESASVFLKNSCGGVRSIIVQHEPTENESLSEFFNLPAVITARHVVFYDLKEGEPVKELVQNWINNNVDVQTAFSVYGIDEGSIDGPSMMKPFAAEFRDRIISQNDTELKIRTNNENIHILMKFLFGGFSFHVIPAENHENQEEN